MVAPSPKAGTRAVGLRIPRIGASGPEEENIGWQFIAGPPSPIRAAAASSLSPGR
nr:hypothetical protein [Mangrovicoccus ximenensis]